MFYGKFTSFFNVKEVLKVNFEISDRLLLKLKRNNKIFLNGNICRIDERVNVGDEVSVLIDFEEDNSNIVPTKMNLDIIYEDDNILLLKGSAFVAMTCAYIFFTGTTTLMILGNIMAVPEEVREAAMLDGASGLKQDWHITIPMIKGTLKTVSVLAATSGFLLYNEVYFLTKGAAGTYSISYIIRELAITSPRTQFGRANAVAMIQILAGMVIILVINFVYSVSFKKEKK